MKCGDSHLEKVSSLRDQRGVQVWFGPDVVGILEKLVPLGKDVQRWKGTKNFASGKSDGLSQRFSSYVIVNETGHFSK